MTLQKENTQKKQRKMVTFIGTMRLGLVMTGLWPLLLCSSHAKKKGDGAFQSSTAFMRPFGSKVNRHHWDDGDVESDESGNMSDDLFEVDDEYYDIRRVDDDELEIKEEDFHMDMPTLKSAVFGTTGSSRVSGGTGKDVLYDAYNQLHTLAQVTF